MKKPVVQIEEWEYIWEGDDVRLSGKVFRHPKLDDGKKVLTSIIVEEHPEAKLVETLDTFYELGTPKNEV